MNIQNKEYTLRIYTSAGVFLGTILLFNWNSFRKQINGGLGSFIFQIPKKIDDFDQNVLIKYNNKVEMWVQDKDSDPQGTLVYSGYIASIGLKASGATESVEITCFGYIGKLAKNIMRVGTTLQLKTALVTGLADTTNDAAAVDIGVLAVGVIDNYRAVATNPVANYTADSIWAASQTLTYIFDKKSHKEALDICVSALTAGWYYYLNAANILYLRSKAATAKHTFTIGDDFTEFEVTKDASNVVNNLLFESDNTDVKILNLYTNAASQTTFDDCWEITRDSRVTDTTTADNVGNAAIAKEKDPKIRVVVNIADNNCSDRGGVDIEQIEPGDTCQFFGFNDITALDFTSNMQIVAVDYYGTHVKIELEELTDSVARVATEAYKAAIEAQGSSGLADYNTTDTRNNWHNIGSTGEPAFENGWLNYDISMYHGAGFMKDDAGIVRLKGLVKSGAGNQTMFTLPAGYRPIGQVIMMCTAGSLVGVIRIEPDGRLRLSDGTNSWASLENLTFMGEQ